MDAISLLKQDHQKARDLFQAFAMAGVAAPEQKLKIAEKIFDELELHTKLEEEIEGRSHCAGSEYTAREGGHWRESPADCGR